MNTADRAELIALIETVARKFYGEPNYDLSRTYSRPNELRFGTNGSLKIDVENGTWYDFEDREGGGVLDLVKRELLFANNREVFEWLEREGLWENKRKGNGKGKSDGIKKVVVDSFEYPRDGVLSFVVERVEFKKPDGSFVLTKSGKHKKTFWQKRPDPDKPGGWIYGIDGCPLLLYKLAEVIEAIGAGRLIVVVEGERKVNLLWSWNVPATCNSGGAGNWKQEHVEFLRGADVLILGDNDDAGSKFVETVGTSLQNIAKSIRVLDLPGLGPKEDILDWEKKGGTVGAFHKLAAQQARPFLTAAQASAQEAALLDPWSRYIVPEFPLDILPPVLRDFAGSQARVIGACLSGMAMATLAAVSAAASHRWSLKMMEYGQWYARPRLWVLLVGDPSEKKTPEIDAACAPLERIQGETYRAYLDAARQWKEVDDKDDPEPEKPPRHVAIDITTQKLGELLARPGADRGLLIKRDELTGWIGEMDRYNNATRATSDRAFWLKAWDGGPYNYDRINRGELFIENLSVSVLGGIQPDRLAELRGLTSDGLLQRFLVVMMTEASFTLDEPTNVNPYYALIRQLVEMPAQPLSMTNDARDKITELRRYLFKLEQNSGPIGKGFQAFIGKLAGYTGSLAIVLHLSEFPNERFIGGKVAGNVDRLVRDFLIPHAFEFYSLGETGDQIRRLASYVLTCGKNRILASDITTNVHDLRGLSLFQVRDRVSVLVAGGWLDPVDNTPTCRAWKVNPAVKLKFAEQAQKEDERKRIITEMLRARKRAAST